MLNTKPLKVNTIERQNTELLKPYITNRPP